MVLRKSIVNRFTFVYVAICIFFAIAAVRMLVILTFEKQNWQNESKRLMCSDKVKVPERGNLYDAKGNLITATIPYYSLYMDLGVEFYTLPKGIKCYKENIDSLCICLSHKLGDKTPQEYRRMIDGAFVKRNRRLKLYPKKVSYIDLMEIKKFPLFRLGQNRSGFFTEEFANRENLYGSLANRTIGDIYGSDGHGQYGLELAYDSLLAGEPGLLRGHLVGIDKWVYVEEKPSKRGADIYTTIDIEMQDIAETVLREKLDVIKAKNACLVLMEVKTGEIKAMVNLQRCADNSYIEGWNMAVADLSEPGSTFKTMSLMVALDHNICDTADVVDINNGVWMFHKSKMTDHNWHHGGYDTLTVSGILAQSSNVGVSRIIDEHYKTDPMKFIEAVKSTGFADKLELGIPGTAVPTIPTPKSKSWSGVTLPWMSIGYTVQVPPIYTLNFYNAIANDGKLMRRYLVKEIRREGNLIMKNSPKVLNSSICKSTTLKKVQGMLEGVVKYGTAKSNNSKEFAIAGKTGTAQLGYGHGGVVKHQVSFCGYFPADKPMYSCIVVVKEPQMAPAAAFMCGDVFKKVAERIYAQEKDKDIDELERWQGDSIQPYNLPNVKAGSRAIIEEAMDKLDLNYQKDKSDWISMSKSSEQAGLISKPRPVLNNLVPNVVGMGAADAVYLLESCGMYVQLYGKGRVVSQSIMNGQNIVKGSTITLTLK
jgi:cell division protein FtsI (penicillin-binding protein 3)